VARTEGRPQLSVQGTLSHTGDPTTYPNAVGAGISIVLPLPDGGARRSRERQAEAAVVQAQAALNLAQRQAVLDLENAYLSAQDARQRVDTTNEAVRLAAESLRAASLGYANNVASTRDVLDAQLALRQSRIQHAEAIYDYNLSVARISNVLGGAPAGAALTPVPPWAVPPAAGTITPASGAIGSGVPGNQNG
ncbi:MAG: TolC family protein, partial [Chloroflexi bacterium]|nr:TolC family protein [Chloroflexota bacterium]